MIESRPVFLEVRSLDRQGSLRSFQDTCVGCLGKNCYHYYNTKTFFTFHRVDFCRESVKAMVSKTAGSLAPLKTVMPNGISSYCVLHCLALAHSLKQTHTHKQVHLSKSLMKLYR